MAINKTFSVRNGLDVANTIVIDSSRNLSNIATANATTVNATNFVTTDGLNLPNHTNNAYAAANAAANTVQVSQNSGSTLSAKQLNFVNSTSVIINVTDSGDGNANIQFSASGASPADAYEQANNARDQANTARTTANDAYGQANSALTVGQNSYEQANTARATANDAYGAANAAQTNISNAYNQANSARDQANTAYGEANLKLNLSGGTLTGNLNVAATLITQNIIPDANITYSIGTVTNRFKDLWLSNSTIYLGDAALSAAGDEMRANTFNAAVSFLNAGLNVLDQANTARNTANDSYGQANSARDQANTARDTANDSYGQANSARDQANTARVTANDAYNQANSALTVGQNAYGQANSALTVGQNSYTQANSARDQANTARDTANDAYAAANTSGTNVLNAYAQANTARTTANDSYAQANTARDTANDAYGAANTAQTTAQNAYGQANSALTVGQNAYGQANTARDTANDAYGQANTARDTANGAYTQANDAYAQANTANSNALAAYGQANLAYTQANTARDTANGAYAQANGAYAQANGAYSQANGAYGQANGAYAQANAAANTVAVFANDTVVLAQANVNFNNSATVNVSVTPNVTTGRANIEFAVNTTSSGITTAYNQANSARDQANTARDAANGAYAQANGAYGQANGAYAQANGAYAQANGAYAHANIVYAQANTARNTANDSYGQANSARDQANTARNQANSAYAEANLKLNLTGGGITGDLTINGNLVVQGNATTINVSNLSVNDSIILLGANATGDVADIGFVGHFDRGATNTHAGFVRIHSLNEFQIFDNYELEPTNNVIDVANYNYRLGNVRFNTLNANSVLILGNSVATQANLTLAHNQANAARDQANTARTTANDAYGEANTAETIALNAYSQANTARDQANTARTQANTARDQANTARDTANGAYAQANGAYAQANGAYGQANGAYGQANTAANTVAVYANDSVVLTKANVNFNNSATVNVSVTSNTSTGRANIEFTVNTTSSGILAANTNAVNAYGQANAARDQANTARTTANDAYGKANTADTNALNAYGQANNARDQANTARTQANTARDTANSAYGQANTATTNAGNAYGVANTAATNALNAYGQANTARDQANTARTTANDAYGQANSGVTIAGNAYNAANSRVLKAGDTMTGQLNISSGGLLVTGNATINSLITTPTINVSNVNYRSPNGANTITSTMYNGGTLSFDSTSGQLFSITDSLTGSIFSVNDISGIPSIEVFDTGEVRLAQYSGNVGLGIANATAKLHVVGTANITSNVIVNGGTFFVDSVANEVGIGTTNPTSNLHVIGTANVSANLTVGAGAVGSPSITTAGDNNTGLYFPAADTIGVVTGGSERARFFANGWFGYGTSTPGLGYHVVAPGVRLETNDGNFDVVQAVSGWTNSTYHQIIRWLFNGVYDDHLYFASGGNAGVTNQSALIISENTGLLFGKGNTNSNTVLTTVNFTVNNSGVGYFRGNVGISTTTPTSNLHVIGTANVTTSLVVGTGSSLNVNAVFAIANSTANTATAALATFNGDPRFKLVAFNGNTTTNASGSEATRFGLCYDLSNSTQFSSGFSFIRGGSAADGSLAILTNATERMRIDATGNVGIGITAPTKKLHVSGSAIISDGATPANNATLLVLDDGVANTVTSSATFRIANDGTSPSFAIFEASSGVSNTVITNAGDMGIGITAPTSKLHVVGSANITAGIVAAGNTNFDSGTLFVDSVNNRVGVGGLTTPAKELDVIGSIQSNTAVFTSASQIRLKTASTTSGYGVLHRHDGSDYYVLITNNNDADGAWNGLRPLSVQLSSGHVTVGNATLTVLHGATTSSGNVGVGTSSPTQKLHVATSSNDDGIILINSSTNGGRIRLHSTGTGGRNWHINSTANGSGDGGGKFIIRDNSASDAGRLTIDSSGNTGIGTTSPTYKLEVNGSFAATTKSFVINHPTKPGMKLRYGSLEGPENGVYVRGKLTGNVIELPDYWPDLVDSESITVNLTPIGKHQKLFVEKIENNKVYVATDEWFGKINCYYTVFAERKDVEKLTVEY